MLHQLVCLSTFGVDVSINRMKISVLAISTKGFLPSRHIDPWELCGKLKGKLWLFSSANESQLGHRYIWGVRSWGSKNQRGWSALRKPWRERACTILALFLDGVLPQVITEPCPKWGSSHYCRDIGSPAYTKLCSLQPGQNWDKIVWYYLQNQLEEKVFSCLFSSDI